MDREGYYGRTSRPRARLPLLSRAQLEAWTSFGPEWDDFKDAWLWRGFLWPPTGSAEDDDDGNSQRHVLWQMLDDRPNDLPRWVRAAPGRTVREVVDYCHRRYHAIRDAIADAEDEREAALYWNRQREQAEATHAITRLRDILRP